MNVCTNLKRRHPHTYDQSFSWVAGILTTPAEGNLIFMIMECINVMAIYITEIPSAPKYNCIYFCPKRLTTVHTYIHTLMAVAAMQGANQHIRISLGFSCYVWIQGLHPSEKHLKANYVTTLCEGCPNLKAPPNASHRCSFFSLFLEDAPLRSSVASHIPRFFARPKKKKGQREDGEIAWRSSSLSRAWAAEVVT